MLKIKNVKVFYQNKTFLEIDQKDFSLGKTYIIIGESGVGKSTLFDFVSGVSKPDFGDVLINGISLYDSGFMELSMLRKKLGVMFDLPGLISNQTVLQNLELVINSKHLTLNQSTEDFICKKYLNFFKLGEFIHSRPAELSNQQQKIISFIRAIISSPEFVIFDNFNDFLMGEFKDLKLKFINELIDSGTGGIYLCKEDIDESYIKFDHKLILKGGGLHEYAAA